MNNGTNNEQFGQVLGNVNDNPNNNYVNNGMNNVNNGVNNVNNGMNNVNYNNEGIETLGALNATPMSNSVNTVNNVNEPYNNPVKPTFFNEPVVNNTPPTNDFFVNNVEPVNSGVQNNVNPVNQVNAVNQVNPVNSVEQANPVNPVNSVNASNGNPKVAPEPAYTNVNNINSMPGFENNSIGTTPPISLEADKQKKPAKNKTLFIVLIILALALVGFGTFYLLKYTDILNNNKPVVTITTKTIEASVGDVLDTDIKSYADISGTDPKNCTVNINDVDMSKEGEYKFSVTCGEIIKQGLVKVVDNTELIVEVKTHHITKGTELTAKDFIVNPDDNYTYEFAEPVLAEGYKNADPGNYTVKIIAKSGNKTKEVEATLIVMEHEIRGYLTCDSKEQLLSDSTNKFITSYRFSILNDGSNSLGEINNLVYKFNFVDETAYNNYLTEYKLNGSIKINDITGTAEFDNDNLTITISNDISKNKAIEEFGQENMTNYATIMVYFRNLGYTCNFDS